MNPYRKLIWTLFTILGTIGALYLIFTEEYGVAFAISAGFAVGDG